MQCITFLVRRSMIKSGLVSCVVGHGRLQWMPLVFPLIRVRFCQDCKRGCYTPLLTGSHVKAHLTQALHVNSMPGNKCEAKEDIF